MKMKAEKDKKKKKKKTVRYSGVVRAGRSPQVTAGGRVKGAGL